jgi:SAM-dependent methyltransferase
MNEASKTKKIWTKKYFEYIKGDGIDIGCGKDPIFSNVFPFDIEQGDANEITKYVNKSFDFVFSSHCLEHMTNPNNAIVEWWKLVKPGGYLFFIVPDEDLYEQGVWPSRFNGDHKATFTISKTKSWSPVSHNVMDLVKLLPEAEMIEIVLHDHNYDRSRLRFGTDFFILKLFKIIFYPFKSILQTKYNGLCERILRRIKIDQTLYPDTLAQIQCIIRKKVVVI